MSPFLLRPQKKAIFLPHLDCQKASVNAQLMPKTFSCLILLNSAPLLKERDGYICLAHNFRVGRNLRGYQISFFIHICI